MTCGEVVPGIVLHTTRVAVMGDVNVTNVLAVIDEALVESNHVTEVAPQFPCRSSNVYWTEYVPAEADASTTLTATLQGTICVLT